MYVIHIVMIATEHVTIGSTNPSVSTRVVKNSLSHCSDPPPPYDPSYCDNECIPDASDNQSTRSTYDGDISLDPPPSYSSVCANYSTATGVSQSSQGHCN